MKQLTEEELTDLVYSISREVTEKEMEIFRDDISKIEKDNYDSFLVAALCTLSATNIRICNETIIKLFNKLNKE